LLIRQRRSIGTRHDISDGNTLAKLRLIQVVEISGRNNARVMRAGVVLTVCGLLPVFRSALRETEFASSRTFRLRTGPQRLPGLLGMRVPVSISCIEVKFFPGRTKLAMQGKNPDEIVEGLRAAYTKGELPRRDVVSFEYMWSVDQDLASGPLASACDGVRAVLNRLRSSRQTRSRWITRARSTNVRMVPFMERSTPMVFVSAGGRRQ
jgi:hypothetical protein